MRKQIAFLVCFALAMTAWVKLVLWGVPLLPDMAVKALGWVFPVFGAGYIVCRVLALRAARARLGDAAAECLNRCI